MSAQTPAPLEAAGIAYRLPETSARVKLSLVLKECDPAAGSIVVEPAAAITPIVNGSDRSYRITRRMIGGSWLQKRNLTVELYPNGAIKSINSGAADQTGAIMVSTLKLAGTLAGAGAFSMVVGGEQRLSTLTAADCSPEAVKALEAHRAMGARLAQLRASLARSDAAAAESAQKMVDSLVAETARLRAGPLSLTLESPIVIEQGSPGAIQWTRHDLAKWFRVPAGVDRYEKVANFALRSCARDLRPDGLGAAAVRELQRRGLPRSLAEEGCAGAPAVTPGGEPCPGDDTCGGRIVFREPRNASVVIETMTQDASWGPRSTFVLARETIPIAQWGAPRYLGRGAGFLESRTISLGLNEYGRRTSFGWTSEARLASALSAANEAAVSLAATAATLEGAELAAQQAEVKALQTQQQLNQLRYCREVLAAGGFVCPTAPAAPPPLP